MQAGSGLALWCEHQVAKLMIDQENHGVNFDSKKAKWLIHQLTEEILEIDRAAVPQLPKMLNKAAEYKKPFLKSGKLAKWPMLYCIEQGLDPELVAGPFSRVWYTPFDMGKTDKIKRILVDYGWKPDEFNTKNLQKDSTELAQKLFIRKEEALAQIVQQYITKNLIEETSLYWKNMLLSELRFRGKRTFAAITQYLMQQRFLPTSPKLTESSLTTVSGTVGKLVMRRVQLSHRRSLLQGLLKEVREDGKLNAGANPCATPTYRMRHRIVVNIPAARSVYGKQLRGLFIGDSTSTCSNRIVDGSYVHGTHWDFVGYDASGLELRMLAHFLNDPEYTRQILEGDIHAYNQYLAGLPTRDDAKTFIYAFIYGAGDAKLGEIVGGSAGDGASLRSRFLQELPALERLINSTRREAEKGYLVGLDGRKLTMRKGYDGKPQLHKALNTRLQGAGAIVMKYSMLILDRWVKGDSLRAYKVLDMHDEGQYTSHPSDTKRLQYHMNNCCRVAGEFLNLNIPLASESKAGASWCNTH